MDILTKAESEWREGRLAAAEALFREAIEARPGDARAASGLAGVLADQDRFDASLRVLARAEPKAPGEVEVVVRRRADVLRRTGRVDEAITALRALVARHPAASGAWQDLSLDLAASGRSEEAGRALDEALASLPGDPRILAVRGIVASIAGRAADAVAAYERALRHADAEDPDWRLRLRTQLAAARAQCGDTVQALGEYRAIVSEAPDAREPRIRLGTLLWGGGRFEEAAAVLEEAHLRFPDEHDAAYYLAESWKQLGRLAEAEALFLATLERFPECTSCHFGLAEVVHEQGRPGEAALHLRHVVAARPDDPDVLGLFAAARYDIGEAEAAREAYERVFALAPEEPRHPYNLALRERDAGRLEEATALFDRSVALAPRMDRALYFAMVCRVERGLISDALPLLRRFAALVPQSRPLIRADPLLDPLKVHADYRSVVGGSLLDFVDPSRPATRDALARIARDLPAPGTERAGMPLDAVLDSALAAAERSRAARTRREVGPPRYFFAVEASEGALALVERDASAPAAAGDVLAVIRRTGRDAYTATGT
jgi:tetratricopeptide (TPR) repeat protein